MPSQKNHLSLINIVSLGIGSIIGAGIFALLGQVVILSGEMTYYAFLIAGIAAMFSGYSYSKLAGRYHGAGGLTDYFHFAFPQHAVSGTLTMIYLLTSVASIAMISKAFGIYITEAFGHPPQAIFWVNTFAILLTVFLSLLNMLQVGDVGRFETLFVFLKISIMVILVIVALFHLDTMVTPLTAEPDGMSFLRSVGITFFAYTGYEVITNATPYVSKPKRTIELGIYLTLTIVMAIYISLAFVVINFTPAAELLHNPETAVANIAAKFMGHTGYVFMFLAAILAFITGNNATFFSIFRINNALCKQGILPKIFLKKLWRQGNIGSVALTLLVIIALLTLNFNAIVNLSCSAYLVSYLGIFAANWKLRKETGSSAFIIILGTIITLLILIAFIASIAKSV